jgi:hypothetical protein
MLNDADALSFTCVFKLVLPTYAQQMADDLQKE